MESIGSRLRKQEKVSRGNLFDWIKSKMERYKLVFHRQVQDH